MNSGCPGDEYRMGIPVDELEIPRVVSIGDSPEAIWRFPGGGELGISRSQVGDSLEANRRFPGVELGIPRR